MKKQRHRTYRTAEGENTARTLLLDSLKTLAVTLISAALLAVVSAAILIKTPDPITGVDAAAWTSLGLSCVAGGMAAQAFARERAESTALASGGMLVFVLLAAALVTGGIDRPLYTVLGYAASVILTYLSAKAAKKLFGARKRKRRTH